MLPKIVIDTNIIVAALLSRKGASFRLISLIDQGYFDFYLSVPLVLEYEEVLLRLLPKLTLTKKDVGSFLDYFCKVGKHQKIFFLWRPYLKDPKDDMVLELAVNASCEYLVSFNLKDFKGSDKFGIKPLTPKDFLTEIGVLNEHA